MTEPLSVNDSKTGRFHKKFKAGASEPAVSYGDNPTRACAWRAYRRRPLRELPVESGGKLRTQFHSSEKCIRQLEQAVTGITVNSLGGLTAAMNDNDGELRAELAKLQQEHRDLDAAIEALHHSPAPDLLRLQRLKKRKLQLRDRISFIEDQITPDIIA